MTEATLAKVGALDNVTPGDFAAVARQSKFAAATTAEDFHARLKADCEAQGRKRRPGTQNRVLRKGLMRHASQSDACPCIFTKQPALESAGFPDTVQAFP